MPNYLMPMARCRETGQTVKSNDLGARFTISQRSDCQRQAETLAAQMQWKTGQVWTGFVDTYTVDDQGRTAL